MTRLARDRRGVTALEFAVIGAIFITLLLGVVEVARYQATLQAVRTLAAEGARAGLIQLNRGLSITPRECTVNQTAIRTAALRLVPLLQDARLTLFTVTHTAGTDCLAADRTVTANVTYNFNFIVRFLPGGTLSITEQASLRF